MKRIFTAVAVTFLMVPSCNKRSFDSNVARREVATEQPQPAATPPPQANTPITQAPVNQPVATVPQPTAPKPGIVDWIGGLLGKIPTVDIATPNPKEIEFGSNKVFHIGDGNMDDSTCKARMGLFYPTRGVQYFFEFEVLEDQSLINVSANTLCGVDYNNVNTAALVKSGTTYANQAIPKGASSLYMNPLVLNKGLYMLIVESHPNTTNRNDRDDFLVGKIKINSNKTLRAGRVGAQN